MSVLLREAIGDSIRRARTGRRRTLRDVSREARVSLGYLSEIERGRKEPSSELLAAICEALSVPLPDLLDAAAATLRPVAIPRPVVDPALRSAVEEALGAAEGDREGGGTSGPAAAPVDPAACAQEPAATAVGAMSPRATSPGAMPLGSSARGALAPVDAPDVRTDLLPGSVVLPGPDLGAPEDVEDLPPGTVALVTRLPRAAPARVEEVARAA